MTGSQAGAAAADEEKKDEIKAVKRKITNIYTRGTTAKFSEQRLHDIEKIKNEDGGVEEQEEANEEENPQRTALFESRYILFFIRASLSLEEMEEKLRNNLTYIPPTAEHESGGVLGFLFFDISML